MEDLPVVMGNKVVGHLRGNVYVTRRGPQHLFRKFDGFGVSEKLLAYLDEALAVREVRFEFHDEAGQKTVYSVPLIVLAVRGQRWVDWSNKFMDAQLVIPRRECKIVSEVVEYGMGNGVFESGKERS